LAVGLLPSRWANRRAAAIGSLVTALAGLQFIFATGLAIVSAVSGGGASHQTLLRWSADLPIAASVYYDGVSSLMLVLVSFVGWVICRYSIRYLDGEATQGRYFRWISFTIGAVSWMVISGNLLMFLAAWISTSLGLHQLLLHYSHRPAAHRAAWTKFVISRLGDFALIVAVVLVFSEFRTLEFAELFAAIASYGERPIGMAGVWAGWLLVCGALTKSAQVPFHTWLPQTMETPTPVSALMHAGIVNAGGYLIIRTSPLVSMTPAALSALAIVGAVTACFAAVVMLTQTSIKRSLAYSTIAQMGFMLLQCGLGAFSAAMLHILAHSLYKANAFLSSGSVIAQRAGTDGVRVPSGGARQVGWVPIASTAAAMVTIYGIAMGCFGISPLTKPGGCLLGFVLCLALTNWIAEVLRTGSREALIRSFAVAAALCFAYALSFFAVDRMVASSLPASHTSPMVWLVTTVVIAGFGGAFLLHMLLPRGSHPRWMHAFYVHASNGFYLDASVRRVFGSLSSS
jgi:NAD(P)H-quinone oxidoreductase subunit 5